MVLEWVFGVLFRPAATFERARQEMRFGYWWILVSVLTIQVVMDLYSPSLPGVDRLSMGDAIWYEAIMLMIIFDLQALFFVAAARAFHWKLPWAEASKFIGLMWSVLLIEDFATFYPSLRGNYPLVLWIELPFFALYLLSFSAGVRRLTGLATWRSMLMVLMAATPVRAGLFWLEWTAIHAPK